MRIPKCKWKCFIIICVILYLILDIWNSKHSLITRYYRIQYEELESNLRIVLLSDLHDSEFGKDNSKLIQRVADEEPDIICITGDLLDRNMNNSEIAKTLIQGLADLAPIYISLGNHEAGCEYISQDEIVYLYEQAGATVLECNYVDLSVKGNSLRIGGFFGYGSPDKNLASTNTHSVYLRDFQNTNCMKILLCHMPLAWYAAGSLDFWNADLVLCGHTHGGQMRIPFIGGIYAPDLGYFPGKEIGIYESSNNLKHMVLTTGLGNSESIPRINNRPEVVVIDLLAGEM